MKLLNAILNFIAIFFGNERGSVEVTTSMVDMFSSNVMHLSQQEGSMLYEYCRQETQDAESKFHDRIGKSKARRKAGRHSDVLFSDIPHSRRMVTTEDIYDADLVDQEDKIRTIMNIENEYTKSIAMSIGRDMDEQIIDFALGSAYGGKKGTVAIPLPDSQKLVATNGTIFTGMNVLTLRRSRKLFKQNESIKKGEKLIFCWAAEQADDLLGSTEVTSSDFNSVKALVDGEVDTFMGFKFVETELLPFIGANVTFELASGKVNVVNDGTALSGEGRRCIAFTAKRGLLAAKAREVNGRITERADKHYANQVYAALSFGGTRMEEEQVMEIICKEV